MLNRNRSDRSSEGLEGKGLELLRRARGLRGLSPVQVGRIAARLATPAGSSRRRILRPALVAFVIVVFAGSVAWATGVWRLPAIGTWFHGRASRMRPLAPAPSSARAPSPAASSVGSASAVASPVSVAAASPVSVAAAAPVSPRRATENGITRPTTARTRSSPQTEAAPQAEDKRPVAAIALEGESLGAVLRLWRHERDGRAALAALDGHDRRFDKGQMKLESRLLRVEILIEERRDGDALAILEGLPLAEKDVPRGRELLTVRGELRVRMGRCAEGRADLEPLARGADGLARRARDALTHCPLPSIEDTP